MSDMIIDQESQQEPEVVNQEREAENRIPSWFEDDK